MDKRYFSINEDFIKNYNKESDEGCFLDIDVQYLEELHELRNDLSFLPERIKTEKVKKLIANLNHKTENVIHVRNLKQALNQGLVFKKVHKVIKFNKNAKLKPYIDMNNAVFEKTKENVRKHRDIKLVTTERRRNYLLSEPNFTTTKFFTEKLLAIEMKKTEIFMNKAPYLGLSRLELSKIFMHEFWHDYIKPKYRENAKLYYMDTDSFILYIKLDDI